MDRKQIIWIFYKTNLVNLKELFKVCASSLFSDNNIRSSGFAAIFFLNKYFLYPPEQIENFKLRWSGRERERECVCVSERERSGNTL